MNTTIYTLLIRLYGVVIYIASFFNKKAAQWISGRKQFPSLNLNQKSIWMHCASLGEFEQGRPVLEAMNKAFPDYPIVLSFFSPSGYEIRKNYALADKVIYLPLDTPQHAKKLIAQINPALVLWVKYEYWLNQLTALNKNNIPILLISGQFRSSQPFFKWYGGLWKQTLSGFNQLFVQQENSLLLLQTIQLDKIASISGDTRFDRVCEIADHPKPIQEILNFFEQKQVIVAGSTWMKDEILLSKFIQKNHQAKLIIVPHEVNEKRTNEIQSLFPNAILFSEWNSETNPQANVLIVNTIGLLSRLYQYATITYVGGGFNKGIHNTLEAAVYGKPVLFGPHFHKFSEAIEMIENKCAFSVNNELEFTAIANNLLNDENLLMETGKEAKEYVYAKKGATEKIVDYVKSKRLLTK